MQPWAVAPMDVEAIRERLRRAEVMAKYAQKHEVDEPWIEVYIRDVAALLAALDKKD